MKGRSRLAGAASIALLFLAGCTSPSTRPASRATVPKTTAPKPAVGGSAQQVASLPFLAQSVSFPTADDGWVIGTVPCGAGRCPQMYTTKTRGHGWLVLPRVPFPVTQAQPSGVSEIVFADQLNGWAFDPGLWATHDGGRSWRQITTIGYVIGLSAGSRYVYADGVACPPYSSAESTCPSQVGRLYRADVTGDSWQQIPDITPAARPSLSAGLASSVLASGSDLYLWTSGNANGSGPLVVSTNDAASFQDEPNPCQGPSGTSRGVATFAAAGATVVAVCGIGQVGPGSYQYRVVESTDAARTWKDLPGTLGGNDDPQVAVSAPTAVLFVDGDGGIYRQVPGAWQRVLVLGTGGDTLPDLTSTDSTHASLIYFSSEQLTSASVHGNVYNLSPEIGSVYLTNDGGNHWSPVRP